MASDQSGHSSDEAPEEFSLELGKEEHKAFVESVSEALKTQKLKKKLKSKEIEQRNIEQKKQKLQELEAQKLSSDILISAQALAQEENEEVEQELNEFRQKNKIEKQKRKKRESDVFVQVKSLEKIADKLTIKPSKGADSKHVNRVSSRTLRLQMRKQSLNPACQKVKKRI